MDAVTAVSGSGPAYFALLAEAMIEAGLLLGLSREISTQLVVQTMLGTAKQLRDEGCIPSSCARWSRRPGGTTIAAIRELEFAGVRAAFLNAIQAAMTRARELAGGDGLAGQRAATRAADVRGPRSRASASSTRTVSATRTSSRNASRSSKERSTRDARRRTPQRRPGERGERVRRPRPARAPRRRSARTTGRLGVVRPSDEEREGGAVAADRAGGVSRAGFERADRHRSARRRRRPASSRQRIIAIGRPQLRAAQPASSSRTRRGAPEPRRAASRRGRASARRARPPTRRRRCPRAGSPPARPGAAGVAAAGARARTAQKRFASQSTVGVSRIAADRTVSQRRVSSPMARELREVVFVDGVRTAFGRAGHGGLFWKTRADDMAVKACASCCGATRRSRPSGSATSSWPRPRRSATRA